MAAMMTIKEAARFTHMSEYAIRKGVTTGLYPAIRVCGNPKGKILINIEEFITTLNTLARQNIASDLSTNPIRRIAE